jgi:hypothetical protein
MLNQVLKNYEEQREKYRKKEEKKRIAREEKHQ